MTDPIYDPEGRGAQRVYTAGQPREDAARLKLVMLWQCHVPSHGECWSSSHLSTREVANETKMCADSCECWRHTIIAYAMKAKHEPRHAFTAISEAERQELLAPMNPFFDAVFANRPGNESRWA